MKYIENFYPYCYNKVKIIDIQLSVLKTRRLQYESYDNRQKSFTERRIFGKSGQQTGKAGQILLRQCSCYRNCHVEKKWQTVEISIKDRKLTFRSEKSADSMEQALDDAVENLEAQIIKNKEKIHRKFNGYAYFDDLPSTDEDEDYEIVRKKVFALQPQSVDDAILEMNMLGHTFFMFKDIVTEEINVVYKRKDGKYGLLFPE